MHLFKSFIQDLDTSFIHSELILLGDFNVNFTGSNLNIDKAMKRKLIQVTNSQNLTSLSTIQAFCLLPSDKHRTPINSSTNVSYFI